MALKTCQMWMTINWLSLLENNNKNPQTIQCITINGNHIPLRLPREQVPSVMWEPGILHGYRSSNQPWSYYFKSLFWIHNETINVWSHLVAPYIILVLVYVLGKDINFFADKSSHGLLLFSSGVTHSLCVQHFCPFAPQQI